jgi:hypothetical protein
VAIVAQMFEFMVHPTRRNRSCILLRATVNRDFNVLAGMPSIRPISSKFIPS